MPADVYASFFPGAGELAQMFGYIERYTYLGTPSDDRIALARRVAGRPATTFVDWARANMPVTAGPVVALTA